MASGYITFITWDFPGGTSSLKKKKKVLCRRFKRCKFDPWVGKVPWRRKWQPTRVSCLKNCMDRGT